MVRCSYRIVHGTQLCIKDAGEKILFTSLANVVLNLQGLELFLLNQVSMMDSVKRDRDMIGYV